jgi:CRP-like cAMP-binding protein
MLRISFRPKSGAIMQPAQSYTKNLLLSGMEPGDYALLQPHLERVPLPRELEVFGAGMPIAFAYFPEGGIASIVADQGEVTIEVGLVGREGFTGGALLMGCDTTPDRSFIQVDGATALRIASSALIEAVERSESLRATLLRFVQVLIVQSARTAASNAAHELPQRLARWLLMCHDRLDDDDIPLTHEFMAMMLGVRRSGVTVTLHMLEGLNGIAAKRGLITIRDRARLEEIAGEAYGVPEAEYRRLLGPFGKPVKAPVHLVAPARTGQG